MLFKFSFKLSLEIVAISFMVGVWSAAIYPPALLWLSGLSLLTGLFLRNKTTLLYSLLIVVFLLVGQWRYQAYWPAVNTGNISFYASDFSDRAATATVFQGTIVRLSSHYDHRKLVISTDGVQSAEDWRAASGRVLVKTYLYPLYIVGQKLEISCPLIKPGKIEDFAYDLYLAKDRIFTTCYRPQIILRGESVSVASQMAGLADKMESMINLHLHEPAASLVNAMLLGRRQLLPDDVRHDF
ncbi:MAG: DUF4131 domain-containing protein, partial [Candidatus Komeilibacteria bacterium]|nr:DUF4131 domain-containing protein [Candidatus Komeilibacteria bacterium]